jgi:hypothetical protein
MACKAAKQHVLRERDIEKWATKRKSVAYSTVFQQPARLPIKELSDEGHQADKGELQMVPNVPPLTAGL